MCRILYIGSDHLLPTVLRNADDPVFNIEPETENFAVTQRLMGAKYVYAAGADGCGCGFNYELWDAPNRDLALKNRSIAALVNFLRSHLPHGTVVETLYCWFGEEGGAPSQASDLTIERLLELQAREGIPENSRFRFRIG